MAAPSPETARYIVVCALIEGAALTAASLLWVLGPEAYRWTASIPLVIAAVAFLKLVHRVVKPPRTGDEER